MSEAAEGEQPELTFDDSDIWQRAVRESAKAFAAFCVYRDLGPTRAIRTAYRIWRKRALEAQGQSQEESERQLSLEMSGSESRPAPSCWRDWRRQWQWDERAAAYDLWCDRRQSADIQRVRIERLKRQLEHDETVRYPQILAVNRRIDELLALPNAMGLAKTQTEDKQTGKVNTIDRAKAFELLNAAAERLEKAYFRPAWPLWDGSGESRPKEGQDAPVNMIGRFEWVPDPEVPELSAPAAEPEESPQKEQ